MRELTESPVLQRVEIYSQGNLQLISQDDRLRLDLIDRPNKVKIDAFKGHADRVVVTQMATPLTAAPAITGSVDEVKEHILNLLEGGKEAFKQRQDKYQALLTS